MNDITFYQRFETDILAGRKTITIRDKSESHFKAGDILRVGRFEDNQYFCTIEVLSVSTITLDALTEQHAAQENMNLAELKEVIKAIYPNEEQFFIIEFRINEELSMNFENRISNNPIKWLLGSVLTTALITIPGMFYLMQYIDSSHTKTLEKEIAHLKPFEDKYERLKEENDKLKSSNKETESKLINVSSQLQKINSENNEIKNKYNELEKTYLSINSEQNLIKNKSKTKNDFIEEQIRTLKGQKEKCFANFTEHSYGSSQTSCEENNKKIDQEINELIKSLN